MSVISYRSYVLYYKAAQLTMCKISVKTPRLRNVFQECEVNKIRTPNMVTGVCNKATPKAWLSAMESDGISGIIRIRMVLFIQKANRGILWESFEDPPIDS